MQTNKPCTWIWGSHRSRKWCRFGQRRWRWEHRCPSGRRWREWRRVESETALSRNWRNSTPESNHLRQDLVIHAKR